MSYLITGTDTGVGKTLVSCALLEAFAAQGKRVAGFKPVAAGCDAEGRNEDAVHLRAASSLQLTYEAVNPYCLRDAIAPHIAARNENVHIELPRIVAGYRELAAQCDVVIVEGVGGFRAPLNDAQDGGDMAVALGLPVIMVVGMRLGCLNHALLTASAIADCGLKCAAWVANILDADMEALAENIATLQQRIAGPLLGVVPFQPGLDVRSAAERLNLELLTKI